MIEVGMLFDIVLAILLLAVIVLLALRRDGPGAADRVLVERLAETKANQEIMGRLERNYQDLSRNQQRTIEVMADALKFIAPYTQLQSDDAVAKFLAEVQRSGEPDEAQGDGL